MQITLNQDEIEDAVRAHVLNQLAIRDDQKIDIELKAGRGENGFTAILDIRNLTTTAGAYGKVIPTTVIHHEPGEYNRPRSIVVKDLTPNTPSTTEAPLAPSVLAQMEKPASTAEPVTAAPMATGKKSLFGHVSAPAEKPAESPAEEFSDMGQTEDNPEDPVEDAPVVDTPKPKAIFDFNPKKAVR